MKLNIVENYGELSRLAALQLLAVLAQGCEKRVNVSITGGATPAGAYEYVSPLLRSCFLNPAGSGKCRSKHLTSTTTGLMTRS